VRERRSHTSAARDRRQSTHARGSQSTHARGSDDAAWLTIAQLCGRWQLGRKTVYKFIDAKLLPAWRVGRRLYRVAVADVLRFEAKNKF
jgi:excisionase family DNA binding protein